MPVLHWLTRDIYIDPLYNARSAFIFDDDERTTLNIAAEGEYVAVLQYHDPALPPSMLARVAAEDGSGLDGLTARAVEVTREMSKGRPDLSEWPSGL